MAPRRRKAVVDDENDDELETAVVKRGGSKRTAVGRAKEEETPAKKKRGNTRRPLSSASEDDELSSSGGEEVKVAAKKRAKSKAKTKAKAKAKGKAKAKAKGRASRPVKQSKEESEEDEESSNSDASPSGSDAAPPDRSMSDVDDMNSSANAGGYLVKIDEKFREASQYTVVVRGSDVYDAHLNQTNLGQNNNKFYVIQLLESVQKPTSFLLWTRWGRVGYDGANAQKTFDDLEDGVAEFSKKFRDKSGNDWLGSAASTMKSFKPKKGKYDLLEMDYEEEDEGVCDKENSPTGASPKKKESPAARKERLIREIPSNLEERVKTLVSLIFDEQMMRDAMQEMDIDSKKLPLGKLSKRTIQRGYECLKEIEEILQNRNRAGFRSALEDACGRFYSVIPHDVGFTNVARLVIDTAEKLKRKVDMLDSLTQIELASKLMDDEHSQEKEEVAPENPLDVHYRSLETNLVALDPKSQMYSMIVDYATKTHGATHNFTITVQDIFEVKRHGEDDRFKSFADNENRMLLWHGSRLSNYVGILSQGLRIAPPEAPVTGYMFGKGVYFADIVSKSAQYCNAYSSKHAGILLLCEVALGEHNELLQSDYNASELPEGKLSTKGVGRMFPSPSETVVLEDGVKVPMGQPIQAEQDQRVLMYNEYIVYNVDQIRIRYLLHTTIK